MRDLKADLEAIREGATLFGDPNPGVNTQYELYEVAEHAIERAIEAEESLKIITALADVERIGELESLVRELAGALWNVMDITLRDGWTREQVKSFEDAKAVYFRAKEVLGDE